MFTPLVGGKKLLLDVTEFRTVLRQINSENLTSNKWPNHFSSGFPGSVLGTSSW